MAISMQYAAEIPPAYNSQIVVRYSRLPLANILLCRSSSFTTLYNKEKVSVENYDRLLLEETRHFERKKSSNAFLLLTAEKFQNFQ